MEHYDWSEAGIVLVEHSTAEIWWLHGWPDGVYQQSI